MAFLKPKDTIAIVSPSGVITNPENVLNSLKILKDWNLNVLQGNSIFDKHNFFSGTDRQRLEDLQNFLDNPQIKAIFFSRGGYGLMRLLPYINLTKFCKYPKILIGFSDITSLLIYIYQQTLFPTIHGPMLNSFSKYNQNDSLNYLYKLLFIDENIEYNISTSEYNIHGNSEGTIVGGNLSIIYSLQGTPYEINTHNKILFIEDVNENIYHIERMLLNLKYSGKFDRLKGLIVGNFINIKDTVPSFGMNVEEVILNILKNYNFPIIFNFPAGHGNINYPILLGSKVSIFVNDKISKVIIYNENR